MSGIQHLLWSCDLSRKSDMLLADICGIPDVSGHRDMRGVNADLRDSAHVHAVPDMHGPADMSSHADMRSRRSDV